jgi:hypothetical protein
MYVCEVQGLTWDLKTESYADGGRSKPDGVVEVDGDKEREAKCSAVTGNFVGRH